MRMRAPVLECWRDARMMPTGGRRRVGVIRRAMMSRCRSIRTRGMIVSRQRTREMGDVVLVLGKGRKAFAIRRWRERPGMLRTSIDRVRFVFPRRDSIRWNDLRRNGHSDEMDGEEKIRMERGRAKAIKLGNCFFFLGNGDIAWNSIGPSCYLIEPRVPRRYTLRLLRLLVVFEVVCLNYI